MLLSHLIYFSRIVDKPGGSLPTDLEDIVQSSQRNNARLQITGALIAHEGYFVQVLEGPLTAVRSVYERILEDHRHRDVRLIVMEPIENRRFSDWAMCVCDPLRLPSRRKSGLHRMEISTLLDVLQVTAAA